MSDPHSNNQVLTEHIALSRTRAGSLADLKTLNMWGYNFKDISIFHKIPNVEIVSLPVNEIERLEPFSNCKKLRALHLRQNQISNLSEIQYLIDLPYLTILDLSDNPITSLPNYRQAIIHALPQLEKLDNIEVTDSERYSHSRSIPQHYQEEIRKEPRPQPQNLASRQIQNLPHEDHQKFSKGNLHPQQAANYNSHDDSAALTAVLALLPELSPQSISVVLEAISKLTD